jgi:hypothetical protein
VLLGRQRVSVTTYEYDDRDRLVRSVTVHDAEWTVEDVDYAKAKRRNDAERCPGPCGLPLSETTDPANQGEYIVPDPTRCFACTELARREEQLAKAKIKPGALIHVERGPGVTR